MHVVSLHVAPARRAPVRALDAVVAEEGRGLTGDRYHGSAHRHVSVQSLEELEQAAAALGRPVAPEATRRNVTVSSGQVPSAPGSRIALGDVVLEVVRIAAPCRVMDDALGEGARAALRRRAGSVCRIVRGGTIRVGDPVDLSPDPVTVTG